MTTPNLDALSDAMQQYRECQARDTQLKQMYAAAGDETKACYVTVEGLPNPARISTSVAHSAIWSALSDNADCMAALSAKLVAAGQQMA